MGWNAWVENVWATLGRLFEDRRTRAFFHWKYSSAIIPAAWGAGVGLITVHKPLWADALFCVSGIWGVAYWLTSDVLDKKRRRAKRLGKRAERVPIRDHPKRNFELLRWGVVLGIISLTGAFIALSHFEQRNYLLEDANANIVVNLSMPANSMDVFQSALKVSNRGGEDITHYTAACGVRAIVFDSGESYPPKGLGVSGVSIYTGVQTLRAGGDGETTHCLADLESKGGVGPPLPTSSVKCADILVEFTYSLSLYPIIRQSKKNRFVMKDGQWSQEPEDGTGERCTIEPPSTDVMPQGVHTAG